MSKYIFYFSVIQISFTSFAFAHTAWGQDLETVSVKGQWNNHKLIDVLKDLQHETDYFFSYSYDAIEDISITSSNDQYNLKSLLAFISAETGLSFKVSNKSVYVFRSLATESGVNKVYIPKLIDHIIPQLSYRILISPPKYSDERTIKGRLIDESGEPLIGATVQVKGSNVGTITDLDGAFTMNIPFGDDIVLVVTYVGYETKEVPINDQLELTIIMKQNENQLDEVVVIGYGTGTKEKFNGSISKVNNDDLNDFSTNSFDQALAGKLSGVQIIGNNKNPDENTIIQIRGVNTLTAGSRPLIVVDGNPLTEGTPFSSINPQDIESISILKDAASAAIYGSRASNGVILVTTKKGVDGKLKVTYDVYSGIQQRIDKMELVDAYEYAQYDYDARNNGYVSGGANRSITDANDIRDAKGGGKRSRIQPFLQDYLSGKPGLTNTNWADAVFRNAVQTNHYLNLSGGNKKTDYAISFGYYNQDNIIIESGYKRFTNNIKLNAAINDRIRFGISSNISLNNTDPVGDRAWSDFTLSAGPDPAYALFLMQPYYPIYNEDGTFAYVNQLNDNNANWDGSISGNIVAQVKSVDYKRQTFRFFGNTFLEIDLLKGLKFKTTLGGDYNTGNEEFFAPNFLGNYRTPVANALTLARKNDNKRQNFINENLLTYDVDLGKNNINILGGYSYQEEFTNSVNLESNAFVDNSIRNVSGGTTITATNGSGKWALESYFTRVQYGYANKYFLSGSYRVDGSSRFGSNTKYGDFASLSAGWSISNEKFFPQNSLISFTKLRFSLGQTGNNQIGNFASTSLIDQDNYVFDGKLNAGAFTNTAPNPDLSWETNTSFNYGVDLGIMKNKFLFTAEYYVSNTTDLLLNVPVPEQSGFSSSLQNIGELQNKGFEFEAKGNDFKIGKVNIDINANFSTTQNKVLALGQGQNQIITSNRIDFLTKVGLPVSQMYVYDLIGVYKSAEDVKADPIKPLAGTEKGDYIVRDVNGDGKITPDDRTVVGDYNPDFTYGFGINAGYKNFDFSAQFFGIEGRKVVDYFLFSSETGEGFTIPTKYYFENYVSDRNPNGTLRSPDFASYSSAARLTNNGSQMVQDADYLRLRSLQMGYTLKNTSLSKSGIESLRFYLTGNNVLNFTKYRGYNPDGIDDRNNTTQTLSRGVMNTTQPLTRFTAIGINVKF